MAAAAFQSSTLAPRRCQTSLYSCSLQPADDDTKADFQASGGDPAPSLLRLILLLDLHEAVWVLRIFCKELQQISEWPHSSN
ncbi:unnamed protein product [Sphagnum balticum]